MSARSAFTLFELLVVIGIIAFLGALSAGAFLAAQRSSGLVGATQVVIDSVRQARHLARSTGLPVQVRLDQGEGSDPSRISGIIQTPLWDLDPDIGRGIGAGPFGRTIQITAPRAIPPQPPRDDNDAEVETTIVQRLDLDARRLPGARQRDGLVLSVRVRLPAFDDAGCWATSATPPHLLRADYEQYLPIIALSESGGGDFADYAFGIGLRHCHDEERFSHPPLPEESRTFPAARGQVQLGVWNLEGWWKSAEGLETLVAHDVENATRSTRSSVDEKLEPLLLPTGTWIDLALRCDGRSLDLLLDGRILSSIAVTGTWNAALPQVHLGHYRDDSGLEVWGVGVEIAAARVSRLATGIEYPLAGGHHFDHDWLLDCWSDGRILLRDPDSGADPVTEQQLFIRSKVQDQAARLDFATDGSITTRIMRDP